MGQKWRAAAGRGGRKEGQKEGRGRRRQTWGQREASETRARDTMEVTKGNGREARTGEMHLTVTNVAEEDVRNNSASREHSRFPANRAGVAESRVGVKGRRRGRRRAGCSPGREPKKATDMATKPAKKGGNDRVINTGVESKGEPKLSGHGLTSPLLAGDKATKRLGKL